MGATRRRLRCHDQSRHRRSQIQADHGQVKRPVVDCQLAQKDPSEIGDMDRVAKFRSRAFSLDALDQRTQDAATLLHFIFGIHTIFIQVFHAAQGFPIGSLLLQPELGELPALLVCEGDEFVVFKAGPRRKFPLGSVVAQGELQDRLHFAFADPQAFE